MSYVRVYQDAADPVQKVGCSTEERPTRRWIQGHEAHYKRDQDNAPLLPIARGGAPCEAGAIPGSDDDVCGLDIARGACVGAFRNGKGKPRGRCRCASGYAGPACAAPDGGDAVDWDPPVSLWAFAQGWAPPRLPPPLRLGLAAVGLAALVAVAHTVAEMRAGRSTLGRAGRAVVVGADDIASRSATDLAAVREFAENRGLAAAALR